RARPRTARTIAIAIRRGPRAPDAWRAPPPPRRASRALRGTVRRAAGGMPSRKAPTRCRRAGRGRRTRDKRNPPGRGCHPPAAPPPRPLLPPPRRPAARRPAPVDGLVLQLVAQLHVRCEPPLGDRAGLDRDAQGAAWLALVAAIGEPTLSQPATELRVGLIQV